MRYYLYKKNDIYNLDSFIKDNQKGSKKYRTVVIAEQTNETIRINFTHFLKKFLTIKEYGLLQGHSSKREALIKFINKNQINENENLYSIIHKNGKIYEPNEFLKIVYGKQNTKNL